LFKATTMSSKGASKAIRGALLALVAGVSCGHLVDPALPDDAVSFIPPPVYAQWWAMVEECSGLQGSLENIQWFAAPGELRDPSNPADLLEGYWSAASNRIVLTSNDTVDGSIVRHEMLHALVRAKGHPRSAFLQHCGGVVACPQACVADAGTAPSPDAATARVTPAEIEVTSDVAVVSPGSSSEPSFGTFTVFAHNPFPYPVVVVLPDHFGGGVATTFSYGIIRLHSGGGVGSGDLAFDIGATYFAAGETKRAVFDFAVLSTPVPSVGTVPGLGSNGIALPPATYTFSGDYGGQSAWDITLILNRY
jgi:hypothetical protein